VRGFVRIIGSAVLWVQSLVAPKELVGFRWRRRADYVAKLTACALLLPRFNVRGLPEVAGIDEENISVWQTRRTNSG
jgi:hypothetical protein